MDTRMEREMDSWLSGYVRERVGGWIEWLSEWVDRWINRWIDGWMNER